VTNPQIDVMEDKTLIDINPGHTRFTMNNILYLITCIDDPDHVEVEDIHPQVNRGHPLPSGITVQILRVAIMTSLGVSRLLG
jgi:hypothetical protein